MNESLLRASADRGVRLVGLSLLADAQKAGDRLRSVALELRDSGRVGDDALHDFRVAVRRLRSWFRAFQPQLRNAVSQGSGDVSRRSPTPRVPLAMRLCTLSGSAANGVR